MKSISLEEASGLLRTVGFEVGSWREIRRSGTDINLRSYVHSTPPSDASALYVYSLHLAGWLPRAQWKILGFDRSTLLPPHEAAMVARLLIGSFDFSALEECNAYLFEFSGAEDRDYAEQLTIAAAVYASLLFECHAYVTTSNRDTPHYLGLQDGETFFFTEKEHESEVVAFLQDLHDNPLKLPLWVHEAPITID